MLLYLKRSFKALTPSIYIPLYKILIWPHLEYAYQAHPPIRSRGAESLEMMQNLAVKFVKDLMYIPHKAALQQLRLFSLPHRRIRGNLNGIVCAEWMGCERSVIWVLLRTGETSWLPEVPWKISLMMHWLFRPAIFFENGSARMLKAWWYRRI